MLMLRAPDPRERSWTSRLQPYLVPFALATHHHRSIVPHNDLSGLTCLNNNFRPFCDSTLTTTNMKKLIIFAFLAASSILILSGCASTNCHSKGSLGLLEVGKTYMIGFGDLGRGEYKILKDEGNGWYLVEHQSHLVRTYWVNMNQAISVEKL